MPPILQSLANQNLSLSDIPVATPALTGTSYVSTGDSLIGKSSGVLTPLESAKFTRLLESNFLMFSWKIPFGVSSTFRKPAVSFLLVVSPSMVVSCLSDFQTLLRTLLLTSFLQGTFSIIVGASIRPLFIRCSLGILVVRTCQL